MKESYETRIFERVVGSALAWSYPGRDKQLRELVQEADTELATLRAENERLRTLVRDVAEAWGDGHPDGFETIEQADAVRDCQREALSFWQRMGEWMMGEGERP